MLIGNYVSKGWTQKNFAVNQFNEIVDCDDSDAVAWCMTGDIVRAEKDGTITYEQRLKLNKIIRDKLNIETCLQFNNHPETTQEQVLQIMQYAEELLLNNPDYGSFKYYIAISKTAQEQVLEIMNYVENTILKNSDCGNFEYYIVISKTVQEQVLEIMDYVGEILLRSPYYSHFKYHIITSQTELEIRYLTQVLLKDIDYYELVRN